MEGTGGLASKHEAAFDQKEYPTIDTSRASEGSNRCTPNAHSSFLFFNLVILYSFPFQCSAQTLVTWSIIHKVRSDVSFFFLHVTLSVVSIAEQAFSVGLKVPVKRETTMVRTTYEMCRNGRKTIDTALAFPVFFQTK